MYNASEIGVLAGLPQRSWMKRSIGVTASAIVALLGSLFGLLLGLVTIFAMILGHRKNPEQLGNTPFALVTVLLAIMYLVPSAWGICTSVGLFRLKNWARISILIFSGLLVFTAVFSSIALALIPIPTPPNSNLGPGFATEVRLGLVLLWAIPAAIAIWWLVLFTRSSVKGQFSPNSAALSGRDSLPPLGRPTRPLSITVIGWLLIVGSAFIPFNLVLRAPAVLFTTLLGGWPATLFYVLIAALNLAVGIALLQLKSWARVAALVLYCFGLVNAAVFYLAPGGDARFEAIMAKQGSLSPWPSTVTNPFMHPIPTGFRILLAVFVIIVTAVPAYFLWIHKEAFTEVPSLE
jgi:hypothetical protein